MKSFINKANKKGISTILSLSILLSTPMQTLALGSKSNSSYFGIPTFMTGLKNTMLKFVGLTPKKLTPKKLTPKEKFAKLILDLKNVKISKNGKIILLSGATLTVAGFIALLVKLALNKKNTPAPTDTTNGGNQPAGNTDELNTVNKKQENETNNKENSINGDSCPTAPTGAKEELEKTKTNLEGNTKAKVETFENKTQEVKNSTNPKEAIDPTAKKGWFKETVDYVKAAPSKIWGWTKEKSSSAWTYSKNKFSAAKTSISGVFSAAGTKISNAAKGVYKFATTNPFKKKAAEPVKPEVVNPKEETTVVTPKEETTVVTPKEETTVVTPKEETTVVTPKEETQAVKEVATKDVKPVEEKVVNTEITTKDGVEAEIKKEANNTENTLEKIVASQNNTTEAIEGIVVENNKEAVVPVEKGNTENKKKLFEK